MGYVDLLIEQPSDEPQEQINSPYADRKSRDLI
jgi:hypothetical protein